MEFTNLPQTLFNAIQDVRYVAICLGGDIALHQRPEISDASDASSDRYEELFVNPAVLLLTERRGRIDCGGLEYVLIRYGNFFQFVQPVPAGHLSVAIEPSAKVLDAVEQIRTTLSELGEK